MGIARVYEQWIDPGMAFTEEQVQSFDIQEYAEGRVRVLTERLLLAMKKEATENVERNLWWTSPKKGVRVELERLVEGNCVKAGIPVPTVELPDRKSKEGKELAKRSLDTEEDNWLGAWEVDIETQKHYLASIAQAKGGPKAVMSPTNKMLARLDVEDHVVGKLRERLDKRLRR